MAFPIPDHLPRRQAPQDVSSKILSKMDAATSETLNSTLVASWITELDQTIQSTKGLIHERIQSDLPAFERQLAASRSIQERLRTLTANVDSLSGSVSDPETGLIPNFVGELTLHSKLAQDAANVRVEFEALSHLHKCGVLQKSLERLINEGNLSEASEACKTMETLLDEVPKHLDDATVIKDLKRRFNSAQLKNEEQLSEAYTRSVACLHHQLTIRTSVQVRRSETTLSLSSVFASLSQISLSNHLATLRRDLTHLFDFTLTQPSEMITTSGMAEHKLVLVPSPPNEENRLTRLDNLSNIFVFLSTHLFQCIPFSQQAQFTGSLCKPTATSILNNVLIPFLPFSFELLPPFLKIVESAVIFEENVLIGLLHNDANDRPVKTWADSVNSHYERQRRLQILDHSRDIIISNLESSDTFLIEVDIGVGSQPKPTVVAVQEEEVAPVEDDAWGLDQDLHSTSGNGLPPEEDGWGFDDDVIPDEPITPERKPESPPTVVKPAEPSPPLEVVNDDTEPDPSEAWGWNDEEEVPQVDEIAWDDPWGDAPESPAPESPVNSRPPPAPSIPSPKVATRLEKAAKKGKKQQLNGSSNTPSPVPSFETFSSPKISTSTSNSASPDPSRQNLLSEKRPSQLDTRPVPKETYAVSGRTKRVISLVEDTLAECKHFLASSLFAASSPTLTSSPGSILLFTVPAILDLYRALYPVKFIKELKSAEQGMRFSNDCIYLAQEVTRVAQVLPRGIAAVVGEQLDECTKNFKLLSESWYLDVVEQERKTVDKTLTEGALGFTYTAEQDRYDECENALMKVLQQVRRFAQQLKPILPKSKYYVIVGVVANTALLHVLTGMLALPDITEVESHRLSELCRILNALEGLFVEDPAQPSFVVAYVPSWLKFSYLSELLEASMADITYLFEEGALVDFQIDELVRLVQALFADTQLRTNTIAKLMGGHPVPTHSS